MRPRISNKFLEAQVEALNRIFGEKMEPYSKTKDGKFVANVGNFHLSGAYGGVALHRMQNEGGGIIDVFSSGHIPKRELSEKISAYLRGLQDSPKKGKP